MRKLASACSWTVGLGFGLPCVYGAIHLARHGEIWQFMGYPTYGDGPFVEVGLETSVGLLIAFALVCAAEVFAGWLLWRGAPAGRQLSFALIPVEIFFWLGFALPYAVLLGLARTLLLVGDRTVDVRQRVALAP